MWDCEIVFVEVMGNNNIESIRVESKVVCFWFKSLILNGGWDENWINVGEIGEYDINCIIFIRFYYKNKV